MNEKKQYRIHIILKHRHAYISSIYTGACNTTHANVKQEFPEHTISGTDQVAIEPTNVMFADISKCLTYTKRTIHTESLHGKQIIVPSNWQNSMHCH